MATEIRVPTLGESVSEATVGRWFKKPGDAVKADEPLVELETDKVTLEVNAPAGRHARRDHRQGRRDRRRRGRCSAPSSRVRGGRSGSAARSPHAEPRPALRRRNPGRRLRQPR